MKTIKKTISILLLFGIAVLGICLSSIHLAKALLPKEDIRTHLRQVDVYDLSLALKVGDQTFLELVEEKITQNPYIKAPTKRILNHKFSSIMVEMVLDYEADGTLETRIPKSTIDSILKQNQKEVINALQLNVTNENQKLVFDSISKDLYQLINQLGTDAIISITELDQMRPYLANTTILLILCGMGGILIVLYYITTVTQFFLYGSISLLIIGIYQMFLNNLFLPIINEMPEENTNLLFLILNSNTKQITEKGIWTGTLILIIALILFLISLYKKFQTQSSRENL